MKTYFKNISFKKMARCESQTIYCWEPRAQLRVNGQSFRRGKPGHPWAVPAP